MDSQIITTETTMQGNKEHQNNRLQSDGFDDSLSFAMMSVNLKMFKTQNFAQDSGDFDPLKKGASSENIFQDLSEKRGQLSKESEMNFKTKSREMQTMQRGQVSERMLENSESLTEKNAMKDEQLLHRQKTIFENVEQTRQTQQHKQALRGLADTMNLHLNIMRKIEQGRHVHTQREIQHIEKLLDSRVVRNAKGDENFRPKGKNLPDTQNKQTLAEPSISNKEKQNQNAANRENKKENFDGQEYKIPIQKYMQASESSNEAPAILKELPLPSRVEEIQRTIFNLLQRMDAQNGRMRFSVQVKSGGRVAVRLQRRANSIDIQLQTDQAAIHKRLAPELEKIRASLQELNAESVDIDLQLFELEGDEQQLQFSNGTNFDGTDQKANLEHGHIQLENDWAICSFIV